MIDLSNMQSALADYKSKIQQRRMTSGERRVLLLQKEEKRLNGQTS